MRKAGWCWLWVAMTVSIIVPGAWGASFDCAQARTPREKAVCGSPELSRADEQMAAAYRAWLAAAVPEWRAGIRADQREWLHSLETDCAPGEAAVPMESCLSDAYGRRIEELRQNVQRKGGVTFVWRAMVVTAPDEPGTLPSYAREEHMGFGTLEASWPQATAATPEWTAWNQAMEAAVRRYAQSGSETQVWKAAPGVDAWAGVTLNTVNGQVVATTISSLWDGHGAHPNHGSREFNWMLRPQRALKAEDLFRPGSGWETWMTGRLDAYLHKAFGVETEQDYKDFLQGKAQEVLRGIATNPERWGLDARGLTITFQPYEVACYACTPEPLTIPWTELKTYLQPGFAVPR